MKNSISLYSSFISLFQRYFFYLTLFLVTNFVKGFLFKSNFILISFCMGIILTMILAKLNNLKAKRKNGTKKLNIIKDILLLAINILTLESLIFEFPNDVILLSNSILRLLDLFCGQTLFLRGFYFKINQAISLIIFSISIIIKFNLYAYNIVFALASIILIGTSTKFADLKRRTCEYCHLSSCDLYFGINSELRISTKNYNLMQYLKTNHLNEKEFLSALLKSRLFEKKEYKFKPEIINIISYFTDLKNTKQDKEQTLEEFLRFLHARTEKNFFFLGKIEILQKNEIIYIWKKKKAIFIKIKQDPYFNEALNLKSLVQNYSKTISYIAHELRNPLNCILNLELIDNSEKSSFDILNAEYIDPAIISSKLMLNLVNGLLDIAQIEADTFKLVIVEFNLKTLLEELIKVMKIQAKSRGIEIKLIFDQQIKRIKSDPNRIRQIIINLLSKLIN